MKWLKKIQQGIGSYILGRKLKSMKRIPVVCNIKDAKKIGIIYNATELTSFEIIKDFSKRMAEYKASVSILGYVHSKNLIDHYLYRKGFDFFYKGNLNWFNKPISDITEKFMNEPFDILINLSLEDHYPIQYITALSAAKFKAGRYTPDDTCLDLMIDIEKEKTLMRSLQAEISFGTDRGLKNKELETDIEKKTETELQLSFLINQLMHYLSIIKKSNL